MKKILTLIIGLLASGLAIPEAAEASRFKIGYSSIYTSGYHSCGCAIKKKKVVTGYNRYHRPVWKYYPIKTRHTCRSYSSYRHHGYRSSYRHRSYGGSYGYRSSSRYGYRSGRSYGYSSRGSSRGRR